MLNIKLADAIKACNGELVVPSGHSAQEYLDKYLEGAVLGSQLVKKGYIFVACKGERTDGHKYIPSAFDNGALAVICEDVPDNLAGPCIKVENSLDALVKLAEYYRSTLDIKTVGIVGSVGKTSTKEFVAGVLGKKFKVLKGEGNHNNLLGLSLEILRITASDELAVLEMGISEFGEMRRLSKLVKPNMIVFTNVGECHLESLGDRDGVLKAKSECFEYLKEDGIVLLNGEDDKLDTITEINGNRPYRFGLSSQDAYAVDVKANKADGSYATICVGDSRIDTYVPLPGKHMVQNAVAAALAGKLYGMSDEAIKEGIESVGVVAGRSNIITTDKYTIIDDCYNASKISMKAAIDLLKTLEGRKVAILGDMFELGDASEAIHREVGKYAVENGIEAIYMVGANSKAMYEEAMGNLLCEMQEICYFAKKEDLIGRLPSLLCEGDSILIKASHGMQFDVLVKHISEM